MFYAVNPCKYTNPAQDLETGTPVHPACFEIFKTMSLQRLGKVDIDGLRQLWFENKDCQDFPDPNRFPAFPVHPDLQLVTEQWYSHEHGTEYLAAHPLRIPGLANMLEACCEHDTGGDATVFAAPEHSSNTSDPFACLPTELKLMIIYQLKRGDVANLRLASRNFQQLPQEYFHHLMSHEMPWVRGDIEQLQTERVNWYKLWCNLSAADGGSRQDEKERLWLRGAMHPPYYWKSLVDGLTEEQRQYVDPREPSKLRWHKPSEDDPEVGRMNEMIEQRKQLGMQWPKKAELKGLRNRRRIYKDITEILDRIVQLDRHDDAEMAARSAAMTALQAQAGAPPAGAMLLG